MAIHLPPAHTHTQNVSQALANAVLSKACASRQGKVNSHAIEGRRHVRFSVRGPAQSHKSVRGAEACLSCKAGVKTHLLLVINSPPMRRAPIPPNILSLCQSSVSIPEACLSCKAGINSPAARDKMTTDASSAEATQYFGTMSVIYIHT